MPPLPHLNEAMPADRAKLIPEFQFHFHYKSLSKHKATTMLLSRWSVVSSKLSTPIRIPPAPIFFFFFSEFFFFPLQTDVGYMFLNYSDSF